jgi:hypothetical protein
MSTFSTSAKEPKQTIFDRSIDLEDKTISENGENCAEKNECTAVSIIDERSWSDLWVAHTCRGPCRDPAESGRPRGHARW